MRRAPGEVLGVSYKLISLRPEKFFGLVKDWIDETPFMVTDREKTIIDGLDLPHYAGGIEEISNALLIGWDQLDEVKLRKYAVKIGNSAVAKRLGFLMETFELGKVEKLREAVKLAPGFSALDPTCLARENTIAGGGSWSIQRLRHDYIGRTASYCRKIGSPFRPGCMEGMDRGPSCDGRESKTMIRHVAVSQFATNTATNTSCL